MTVNLMMASREWANRPDDERFANLTELHLAMVANRHASEEYEASWADLAFEAMNDAVMLTGKAGNAARLTHFSFGQVAAYLGAPAEFLRKLPVLTAVQALRDCLAIERPESDALLLVNKAGNTVRGITTEQYGRIWCADVTQRLLSMPSRGWRVPPARPCRPDQKGMRFATAADVLDDAFALSVNIGDPIAPAGLYASDRDMFVFMVNERYRLTDGLARGFIVQNSEVGNGRAFKIILFYYNHVCGNHIIWDASDVKEFRIVHRGDNVLDRWNVTLSVLDKFAQASVEEDNAKMVAAKHMVLGATKDEVLDAIFRMRDLGLTKGAIEAGYDAAETFEAESWNPRTTWGMVQGLTLHSQSLPYQSDRVAIDTAAGKLLRKAW